MVLRDLVFSRFVLFKLAHIQLVHQNLNGSIAGGFFISLSETLIDIDVANNEVRTKTKTKTQDK
jgi:hypothetical protein